jgi:hypothetical protein
MTAGPTTVTGDGKKICHKLFETIMDGIVPSGTRVLLQQQDVVIPV